MSAIINNIKGDRVIWIVVILLSIFSLLAVYSSTGTLAYKFQGGNTEYYISKHFVILVMGLVLMYLAHKVNYVYFSPIFNIVLYLSIFLLIVTLFFGLELNEAKRVLPLPFNLTFQTSDLAKLTLIIYLARLLTKKQDKIKDLKTAFLPLMVPILATVTLILPENLSTAGMLFITSLVLMFIGGVNFKHLFVTVVLSGVLLIMYLFIADLRKDDNTRVGTWSNRLETYTSGNGNNYQKEQALIAIASGGLLGKMPGNSTQRNFLPHPYSDFIFAIIIEEYGFAGGSFIVFLYLILLFRAIIIVTKIPQTFGAFLTIGLAFSLVFQAMVNMGVAVGILPVTGQPLPLISMGGTSIWFTSLSLGIILSVSKEVAKKYKPIAEDELPVENNH